MGARRSPVQLLLGILLGLVILGGLPGVVRASPPTTNDFCPVTPEEWAEPGISTEYQGKIIYFCCKRCRMQFLEDPGRYLDRLPQFSVAPDPAERSPPSSSPAAIHGSHDHGGDHGSREPSPGLLSRTYRFAGKLHPLAVHFPIALVVVAFLLELAFLMTNQLPFRDSARTLLPIAAFSALVAAVLGWAAGAHARYPGDLGTVLTQHRWLGLSTAGVAAMAALSSRLEQHRPRLVLATRVLLVVAVAFVAVTGHLGATLIYGTDHLRW